MIKRTLNLLCVLSLFLCVATVVFFGGHAWAITPSGIVDCWGAWQLDNHSWVRWALHRWGDDAGAVALMFLLLPAYRLRCWFDDREGRKHGKSLAPSPL